MILPYPISTNRYWRSFRGRTVRSAEATAYKKHVALIAKAGGVRVIDGDVTLRISLHPKTTKAGVASKTCIDLDNALKVTIDALNGVAYTDDKQVKKIIAEVREPVRDGALTVYVEAYRAEC